MIRYCTLVDSSSLPYALALLRSLQHHGGDYHVHCLAADELVAAVLEEQLNRDVTTLRLSALLQHNPNLTEARGALTDRAFALHLRPWLLNHLLPSIPKASLLTLLPPQVFFFQAPQIIVDSIGEASIALSGINGLSQKETETYSNAWISLRHDTTGIACAKSWSLRSLHRSGHHWFTANHGSKLDSTFPEVVSAHTAIVSGVFSPTPNLPSHKITPGPAINGQNVVAFHFHGLRHLDLGVYDTGHDLRSAPFPAPLRELIYQPYLQELEINGHGTHSPDVIPLSNAADPRSAHILGQFLTLKIAEIQSLDDLHDALAHSRAENSRLAAELRTKTAESERYIDQVEKDRDHQRQSFFATRKRLEEVHDDLLHNIDYLKKLEAEAEARNRAAQEREEYVASLKQQLAERHQGGATGSDLVHLHQALLPYGNNIRRLLVARHAPALMPFLLSLAAQGVTIEVLASPENLIGRQHDRVHFLGGNIWDWLGGLESDFAEATYLKTNPDVTQAIADGVVASGWEHYLRFGQREGRTTGIPEYRAGLADFDAIAFDSADAGEIVPCVVGRLQPHHQLFISNSFNPATVWLPADTPRTIVLDDLLCCPRPSPTWLGPPSPSALPVPHRDSRGTMPFPTSPTQPAVWPRITIIVTCKNQFARCQDTLSSVLAQHYPVLECLVVDGQSNDGTVDLLRSVSDQLAWWTSEPFESNIDAINLALGKATGDLIAWLQPGDRLTPGSLYTVAQQFLLHAPDAIGGRCRVVTPAASRTQRCILALGRMQALPVAALQNIDGFWLADAFFRTPAIYLTRSALQSVGGKMTLSPAPTYALTIALTRQGVRWLPLPEVLAIQPEENLSTEKRPALEKLATSLAL